MIKNLIICVSSLLAGLVFDLNANSMQISGSNIQISGNKRISNATITTYVGEKGKDEDDNEYHDRIIKALYSTSFFKDVKVGKENGVLKITVVEQPKINQVVIEGNIKTNDKTIFDNLKTKENQILDKSKIKIDTKTIQGVYNSKGLFFVKVFAQEMKLSDNRTNIIFKVIEGPKAKIKNVVVKGNKYFKTAKLLSLIQTRKTNILGAFGTYILGGADLYNPMILEMDKDRLKQFYNMNGFLDFEINDMQIELARDRKSFYITFYVKEGEQYDIKSVNLKSEIEGIDVSQFKNFVKRIKQGDKLEEIVIRKHAALLQKKMFQNKYLSHAIIDFKINKDEKDKTVDVDFTIKNAPNLYIENIIVTGNKYTNDKTIRRRLKFNEGDRYSPLMIEESKAEIKRIGGIGGVDIKNMQIASDKANMEVNVKEIATGLSSIKGDFGYSSTDGITYGAGFSNPNFMGTGDIASLSFERSQRKKGQLKMDYIMPYFMGNEDLTLGLGFGITKAYARQNSNLKDSDSWWKKSLFNKDKGAPIYTMFNYDVFLRYKINDDIAHRVSYEMQSMTNKSMNLKDKINIVKNHTGAKMIGRHKEYNDAAEFINVKASNQKTEQGTISYKGKTYTEEEQEKAKKTNDEIINQWLNDKNIRQSVFDVGKKYEKFVAEYKKAEVGNKIISSIIGNTIYYNPHSLNTKDRYGMSVSHEYSGFLFGDVKYHKLGFNFNYDYQISDRLDFNLNLNSGYIKNQNNISVQQKYNIGYMNFLGFAPTGLGPYIKSAFAGEEIRLGATKFYSIKPKISFPIGNQRDLNLKGHIYTQIGSYWDSGYKNYSKYYISDNDHKIRTSIGAGVSFTIPIIGSIGLYYTVPVKYDKANDEVQKFAISVGSSF